MAKLNDLSRCFAILRCACLRSSTRFLGHNLRTRKLRRWSTAGAHSLTLIHLQQDGEPGPLSKSPYLPDDQCLIPSLLISFLKAILPPSTLVTRSRSSSLLAVANVPHRLGPKSYIHTFRPPSHHDVPFLSYPSSQILAPPPAIPSRRCPRPQYSPRQKFQLRAHPAVQNKNKSRVVADTIMPSRLRRERAG